METYLIPYPFSKQGAFKGCLLKIRVNTSLRHIMSFYCDFPQHCAISHFLKTSLDFHQIAFVVKPFTFSDVAQICAQMIIFVVKIMEPLGQERLR